jgi:pyruvate dehydrogenase kinase 2/3/4
LSLSLWPCYLRSCWHTKLIFRYFSPPPASTLYPPDVHTYNESFTGLLQNIKKRHDPTVTSVAQGVLEWKRKNKQAGPVGQNIQEWLDRFYLSRIGIRFLIGQRESS